MRGVFPRIISLLSILLIFSIVLQQPTAGMDTQAVAEIKVAFLSPETGALSVYSPGFVNAGKLAFDELKDANPSITWEWRVFDTKTTPEGSAAAMTAAVAYGATYVVGAAGSSNTLAAAAIAKTEKVPLISYASTSPALSDFADDGYLWRVVPSDGFQGSAMADIAETAGYASAVILHLDNTYGAGVAASFSNSFNGTVTKSVPYDPRYYDAAFLVNEIEAESPDVIIDVSFATDGAKIFVQMASQNLTIPIIAGDGVADNAIFDVQAGTAEAMLNLIATKPTRIETDATRAFAAAYAAAGYIGGIYTGEAYDAVYVGALATIAADSVVSADIIVELATLVYDGGSGKKIFDTNGDITTAAYLVMQVKKDALGTIAFEEIGTWVDGTLTIGNEVLVSPPSSITTPDDSSITPVDNSTTTNTDNSGGLTNNSTTNKSPSIEIPSLPFPTYLVLPTLILIPGIRKFQKK